jgi:hypothetical protein
MEKFHIHTDEIEIASPTRLAEIGHAISQGWKYSWSHFTEVDSKRVLVDTFTR